MRSCLAFWYRQAASPTWSLKGDKEIGDKMNKIISKLAEANDLKGVPRKRCVTNLRGGRYGWQASQRRIDSECPPPTCHGSDWLSR
jgi:hypothetical protein